MSLIFLGDGAEEDLPEFQELDDFDDLAHDITPDFDKLQLSRTTTPPIMQAIGRSMTIRRLST